MSSCDDPFSLLEITFTSNQQEWKSFNINTDSSSFFSTGQFLARALFEGCSTSLDDRFYLNKYISQDLIAPFRCLMEAMGSLPKLVRTRRVRRGSRPLLPDAHRRQPLAASLLICLRYDSAKDRFWHRLTALDY